MLVCSRVKRVSQMDENPGIRLNYFVIAAFSLKFRFQNVENPITCPAYTFIITG